MKFSVDNSSLVHQLQTIVGVVERRQTLPILANVLIDLDGGSLSLTGTDLEVEVVSAIQDIETPQEPVQLTVPARKLLDICKSLPDDVDVTFNISDPDRVVVTSGRSRFTLSCLPAKEFPSIEKGEAKLNLVLAAQDLKALIDSTSFAMAQQDVRYYLNGMLWEFAGGTLRAVATDGHRLAMATLDELANVELDPSEALQIIIPRKGVTELSRLLTNDHGDASVRVVNSHLEVKSGGFIFTTKLVDGSYPDYERVVPQGGTRTIVGDRESLRQAFNRAAILSNEKYRGVRLMLADDVLEIIANNPEQEEAEESLTVDYKGGEIEIGFNVNYILDVLNTIKGDKVSFTLSDANSSALVSEPGDQSAVYVIMPMRL